MSSLSNPSSQTVPTAPLLHPPPSFSPVAPHIYRSSSPTTSSHPFLSSLQLRTIVSLTPEQPSHSLVSFSRRNKVRLLHLTDKRWPSLDRSDEFTTQNQPERPPPSSSFSSPLVPVRFLSTSSRPISNPSITDEVVKDALEILLDVSNHPVLVTDTSGIHETGVLLGCLRKLQRWNFASILVEYRSFAGNKSRAANERFIEMFDTDLIATPPHPLLPTWYKQQLDLDSKEMEEIERLEAMAEEEMIVSAVERSSEVDSTSSQLAPSQLALTEAQGPRKRRFEPVGGGAGRHASHISKALSPTGTTFALCTLLLLSVVPTTSAFQLPSLFMPASFDGRKLVERPASQPYQGLEYRLGSKFVFRPALFRAEAVLLSVSFLFLLVHLVGKSRNRLLANRWAKAALPILDQEFALVARGAGGKSKSGGDDDGDILTWNGGGSALIYASGRRNVESLHALITLKPRHDPMERLYNFLYDTATAETVSSSRDLITLSFTLPQSEPDNLCGVFGVVDKSELRTTRMGRFDLSFAKVNENESATSSRGISNRWAIMSESNDLTDQILGEEGRKGEEQRDRIGLAKLLESEAGQRLESLILSDQPSQRPTQGPLKPEQRWRRITATIRLSKVAREVKESVEILQCCLNLSDALCSSNNNRSNGGIKLKTETINKLKRTRQEVDKELMEEVTKEAREEEEERKSEAKRKAEREKLEKLSPAEQARRKEVERKRQLRKAQGKQAVKAR
ncbi:hypothetical protein IE53DRAFT_388791 [Violaceomyces palustris]|uniref:Uncharacterized protein n=1 Tax=Violaceomyces palustris TaxID=1673888 RepID=A0ACD0NT66_9BASI|nr:hypothetical protein IE53DRAFT_388791 [Violaceomyces palustris]